MLFKVLAIFLMAFQASEAKPTLTRVEDGVELLVPFNENGRILVESINITSNNKDIEFGPLSFTPEPVVEDGKSYLEGQSAALTLLNCQKNIKKIDIFLSYDLCCKDGENITKNKQFHKYTLDWPQECQQNIFQRITGFISSLLSETNSYLLQIVLALILGLLMSLTPCLYPMIPITMGVLQAQGDRKSIGKNFTLALSYTTGIACTFALLGLTAAFTGQLFGKIMQNKLVLIFLVIWLMYMALGMMGFYEIYMPKLGQQNGPKKRGSYLTAFLFGAVSGTVASPCLSPGLALLLTLVAASADILKGFFLLFSFGIGLGIPLTIIGTFSNSLSYLPRAGMWMMEIKKVFGYLLLAMSFYFAKNIFPLNIWLFIVSVTSVLITIYLLKQIKKRDSCCLRIYKVLSSFIIISIPLVLYDNIKKNKQLINWQSSIEKAQILSQNNSKNLLIDFTTDYCSLCKEIEKKLFSKQEVVSKIEKSFNPVYINLSLEQNEIWQNKFNIKGVPVIIIADQNLNIIKRFGSEIINLEAQDFIKQLTNHEKN